MAVSQNTLGRRADQDTPTSNEGLLTSEAGDTSAMDRGDSKKTSPSQAGKAKKGPRYTKSGNVLCSVVMLDGHNVDFELPKSAKGQDLVGKACESLQLLEKDYFSCSYMVNDVRFWVNHEKKLSKQMKGNLWDFKFEVKFYPPEPQHMAEDITRYQLFLQVRTDVYTGKLPCSFMTHCLLGSLAAQSEFGDYDPEELGVGLQYLKESAPYAPNQSDEMLEKICELHKTHRGLTPADAELAYLDNAKLMALYGVDLHRGKDKDDCDVMVGVSSAGLSIYKEKLRIHRFPWAKILKFAYKRNFFYIKNRPGENERQATNLTYKLANYTMAKRLWKVAVEQHSFFRLKEAESPKRAVFPLFGSKFRYSGRTQFQTRNAASNIERKTPTIDRAASRKYAGNWKNYDTSGNTLERRNFFDGPSYSTDRVEEVIVPGDSHTTTLDIKSIRKNKGPVLSSEDDRNLSVSDQQYDGSVSFQGPNYSSASYSRQLGPGGYPGQEPRFDQFGNPIPSTRAGLEGPYGTNGNSTEGRKTGPPVLEKPKNAKGNMNGDHEDEDLPPYQEDHFMMKGGGAGGRDKFGGQYSSSTTSKTTTRTYRGADGVMVTEHKVEKDGVIETRIEKKKLLANEDDYDHDKALRDAIFAVTEMNPDLSVEKIEIQTERSDRK